VPTEWFRNENWSPAIETHFFEKLKRARDKSQYLRIQAGYLAENRPEIALMLLEKYFSLGDHFDKAQAFLDQATAYTSLGRIEEAIWSLLKALKREQEFPNLRTQAWSSYALLVVSNNLKSQFEKTTQILDEQKSQLTFPVDKFVWHAAYALIKEAQGSLQAARDEANEALAAAQMDHSGFRYHPKVGLVGSDYDEIRNRLLGLIAKTRH
jgi:tetratricopeptide (TPR) repeat protein